MFDVLRQICRLGRVVCGLGQLIQNSLEKLPRRLAGKRQRDDPLRRCTKQQQTDKPIGQLIRFPGSGRGADHRVRNPLHDGTSPGLAAVFSG